MHQELRALKSRIHDKDQELLTVYQRSSKCDQELLQHHNLLREAEEAPLTKA
jgi:hypothetical protein